MLQERHEELDGGRRCDRGETWSSDGAHLVERTVGEGLGKCKRFSVTHTVINGPRHVRLQARRYRYNNNIPIAERLGSDST